MCRARGWRGRRRRWRCDYHRLASPGVVALKPDRTPDGDGVDGVFSIINRCVDARPWASSHALLMAMCTVGDATACARCARAILTPPPPRSARVNRTPEIFAVARGRDSLLGALQQAARKRLDVGVSSG